MDHVNSEQSEPHEVHHLGPVEVTKFENRVVIRLCRPETRNAINADVVHGLHTACTMLEKEPAVALIAGSGGNFAAGADITQLRDRRREDALQGINSRIFDRIHCLPMPVIGLLNGYVLGGGAELAYACDFRIGTPSVRLGNPEPGLGIIAAAGGSWRLKELVGEPVAKEILLTGRILGAEDALAVRLLSEVVPEGDLESAGHKLADKIAALVPLAVRLTKHAFHAPRSAHPYVDDLTQAVLFETEEKKARMTKFLEKQRKKC